MRGAPADGEAIRRLRRTRGLTQEALAATVGCDVKTVRNAERSNNVDLHTLGRIAEALQVSFRRIIQDAGDTDERQRITTVKRYWKLIIDRNVDAIMETLHDDVVLRLPGAPDIPFAGEHHGKSEVRRAHETMFATVEAKPTRPDCAWVVACDNLVIACGTAHFEIKTNGMAAKQPVIHVVRFESSKIIESDAGYDSLQLSKLLEAPPRRRGC